jgi:hypothetical protein
MKTPIIKILSYVYLYLNIWTVLLCPERKQVNDHTKWMFSCGFDGNNQGQDFYDEKYF